MGFHVDHSLDSKLLRLECTLRNSAEVSSFLGLAVMITEAGTASLVRVVYVIMTVESSLSHLVRRMVVANGPDVGKERVKFLRDFELTEFGPFSRKSRIDTDVQKVGCGMRSGTLGKKGKLAPRHVGPLEIVGIVSMWGLAVWI
ncbi:hypothetical protein Tco_0925525 [Tanacetum coccineum]|uniref:Uncharacterized protein n=1 Tax=Tanacetum coccineum TaxID=301880 RepID=A0ABQ5D741_9ASTR